MGRRGEQDVPRASADIAAAARLLVPGGRSTRVDDVLHLATRLLSDGEKVSVQVSLLTDVQHVPAGIGLPDGVLGGTSALAESLCTVTAAQRAPLVVADAAADPRVSALPPVTSGAVGAYLGVPLMSGGAVVGAVCAFCAEPRSWSPADVEVLGELARAVVTNLEHDVLAEELSETALRWDLARAAAGIGSFDWDLRTDHLECDARTFALFGIAPDVADLRPEHAFARIHPEDRAAVEAAVATAVDACGDYAAEFRVLLPGGGEHWLVARGRAFPGLDGAPARLVGTVHDVTSIRSARDEAARLLETMVAGVLAVDADWTITYVNAEGSRILRLPPADVVGRSLWETFPGLDESDFGTAYRRAVATGERVQVEAYYDHLSAWYDVRAVPAGSGLVLHFLDVTARHTEQARAARAAERLALLESVSYELADAGLDGEAAFARLAQTVVPVLADWSLVSVVHDGMLRDVGTRHVDPRLQPVAERYVAHRLVGRRDLGPVQRAGETGRPIIVQSGLLEQTLPALGNDVARAALRQLAPESTVVIPLMARGEMIGVLTLLRGAERSPATDEEVATAREIGLRAGLALENARLYSRQRHVVEMLQRRLLTLPPAPPGLQVAARYLAADEEASVGGDWYDAFAQPTGDMLLVIGDVVGHDTSAAAAMGQLRGVLRGLGWNSASDPAQILNRLDAAIGGLDLSTTATAAVCRLVADGDHTRGGASSLEWSSAGHPPPVLLGPDGTPRFLSGDEQDLLLGVDASTPRTCRTEQVAAGSTLLLYSDGLVERRGQDLDAGLARLADAVRGLHLTPVEEVADLLLQRMLDERVEDDVALLAVRLTTGA